MVPIGAILGAALTGPILASTSRNRSLILTDFIGLFGALGGLIKITWTLYVARFFIGLAVGLNTSIIPIYIKECTPLSLRGSVGSMN
jgi:MFS family permease